MVDLDRIGDWWSQRYKTKHEITLPPYCLQALPTSRWVQPNHIRRRERIPGTPRQTMTAIPWISCHCELYRFLVSIVRRARRCFVELWLNSIKYSIDFGLLNWHKR